MHTEHTETRGSYTICREDGKVWVWQNLCWMPLYAIIRSALSGRGNGPIYINRANGRPHHAYTNG